MAGGINSVNRLLPGLIQPAKAEQAKAATSEAPGASFSELFSNMIDSTNELQHESAEIQRALINGDPVELHQVMIKAREAGVSMDMLLEIRNRLMNAYNEIMRMPM